MRDSFNLPQIKVLFQNIYTIYTILHIKGFLQTTLDEIKETLSMAP